MAGLEETLRRLAEERDEADRRYNEALTALDRSVGRSLELGDPAPAFDDHQISALNEAWNILPGPPPVSGVRGKLAGFIWRIVSPYLQRQTTFNSRVVDHLNRHLSAARESHRAGADAAAALRAHAAAIGEVEAHLIGYLQQVTLYVDTRDRAAAGGALVLNAALSGVADDVARRAESGAALARRLEARVASLAVTDGELRASLDILQQSSLVMKRELSRLSPGGAGVTAPAAEPAVASGQAFAPALDAYKYLAFENRFRGSRDVIRARLGTYLPFFAGVADVLDIGCGRGEFLELLAGAGISARGIDLNHEMAESCRARGLDVTEADAVSYLSSLPDGALGGIFAAQVVEHLQPTYLLSFLELAFHKLRPGGIIVLETLNPACWVAFFDSYIRDITHVWPLHPETLQFLVTASGFSRAEIEYRSPVPARDRLEELQVPADGPRSLADVAEAFNANVEKLNARLFTFLDYAIIGRR